MGSEPDLIQSDIPLSSIFAFHAASTSPDNNIISDYVMVVSYSYFKLQKYKKLLESNDKSSYKIFVVCEF